MNNLDFVAIGEIAVDAFIKLEEAEVKCDENGQNCKLCIDYGAKIPYESVEEVPAVANASNAAISASKLGLRSALVANIGKDLSGEKCLEVFKREGVNTDFILSHEGKATNYHYILWFQKDRTILQKHSEFDYKLPDIGSPKWIYLTSLGESSLPFHKEISDYMKAHPETKLAFQPGIFQIKFGKDALKDTYLDTEIFFCNVEEAQTILGESSRDVKTLMNGIATLGPKIVVVTDGYEGAYAFDTRTNEYLFMPVYPHLPTERTGAGDAFASTLVSMLACGKTLEEALVRAPINSMSVVQQVGAQKGLLSLEKLEEYLANAPADYITRKI